jgi:hypothetical protein
MRLLPISQRLPENCFATIDMRRMNRGLVR